MNEDDALTLAYLKREALALEQRLEGQLDDLYGQAGYRRTPGGVERIRPGDQAGQKEPIARHLRSV